MFGVETCDAQWDQFCKDAMEANFGPQPIGHDEYGVQECAEGSTIDPSLLQNLDHMPPGLGVPAGPSVDTFVDPMPFVIECSQTET